MRSAGTRLSRASSSTGSRRRAFPVPSWVDSEDRRLRRSWIFGDGVYDLPVDPGRALPAFRRHGVLLDPDTTLASV
ncbi:hypothetical protein [Clavibacter zhangzhiyongii]|uniref:hypothetical protein n=1 Tax=Clavibacter zhangzhiyongii TaxID=2768071 RepID=UPI0039E16FD9